MAVLTVLVCALMASMGRAASPGPVSTATLPVVKKAIEGQKGHVVVVNFWATWCGPCVAEFPALVRLAHRYRSKGLVVYAVSADMVSDIDSKVKPFVAKQGADFPVYIQQSDDPADFINGFDTKWQGDLPRTFIYDKKGQLVKELSGEQTEKSFIDAVKPLL
jgi:thiol-disulfide isomerase/thioredoxin